MSLEMGNIVNNSFEYSVISFISFSNNNVETGYTDSIFFEKRLHPVGRYNKNSPN